MSNRSVIESLRERGFEVRISHHRPLANLFGAGDCTWMAGLGENEFYPFVTQHRLEELREHGYPAHFTPKGGLTHVHLERGGLWVEDFAFCSELDNFDRRLGTTIALGRAVKAFERTYEEMSP